MSVESAARRVARTWSDHGRKRPDAHRRSMDELRRHWPELAGALDALDTALQGPPPGVRPASAILCARSGGKTDPQAARALALEADLVADVRAHRSLGRTVHRVEVAPDVAQLLLSRDGVLRLDFGLDVRDEVPAGTWRLVFDGPLP